MLKSHIFNGFLVAALGAAASPVLATDTGDAPSSYGTATHEIIENAAHLGDAGPDNNEPVFSNLADGDDLSDFDDEDGLIEFPVLVQNTQAYGVNVRVRNSSGGVAFLSGWIDFDGNGTFDADEFTTRPVRGNRPNRLLNVRLVWPSLAGVSSDFFGPSFARFRIASLPFAAEDATRTVADGEVEDYSIQIVSSDEAGQILGFNGADTDNDGIPDEVEGLGDSDGDGVMDSLDVDSDNDTIPDFIEAGDNPSMPIDTDGDGLPDFVDLDSNADGVPDGIVLGDDTDGDSILDDFEGAGDFDGDGILNVSDIDSDNDLIPDAIEFGAGPSPRDTEGDGAPDFLDLDSDNDGIPDIFESNFAVLSATTFDTDASGQVDSDFDFGANGFVDSAETEEESGIPVFTLADSDGDGLRDFMDLDSDADNISDALESGAIDSDGDGIVDGGVDPPAEIPTEPVVDEPLPPVDEPLDDDIVADGTIETGLSGVAGCSVNGTGKEGMLSAMALLSLLILGVRRRKAQPVKNRNYD